MIDTVEASSTSPLWIVKYMQQCYYRQYRLRIFL